jgi:hypothetical protein
MARISATTVMKSMCIGLPQLPASRDVQERQGKENDREQQHQSILHGESRSSLG